MRYVFELYAQPVDTARFFTKKYWSDRFVVSRNNVEEKTSFHLKNVYEANTFLSSLIMISSEICFWIICTASRFGTFFHKEILV